MVETIVTTLPIDVGMESRIGGRAENQDLYGHATTTRGLLLVVCDGMGGGPCGSRASKIAVSTIIDVVEHANSDTTDAEVVAAAIESANCALRQAIREDNSLVGMGTTAVVILIGKVNAIIGHVGDSRCYHLRRNKVVFKTSDHSKVGELVRMGVLTEEQARLSGESNVITRALGIADSCNVEIDIRPFEKGDRFVLCSDGIWGAMPEKQLVKILTDSPSVMGTAESAAITVDEIGHEKGGHYDNLTLIVAEVKTDSLVNQSDRFNFNGKPLVVLLSSLLILSLLGNVLLMCTRGNAQRDDNESQKIDSVAIEYGSRDNSQSVIVKLEDSIKKLNNRVLQLQTTNIKNEINTADKKTLEAELDRIISKLESLKRMKKSDDKIKQIEMIKSDLMQLRVEKTVKGEIDNCIDLLSAKIAKEDPIDKEQGHYNAIIRKLQSLKNNL